MRGSSGRRLGLRFFLICATAALALASVATGAESKADQMREVMAENLVEIKVADRAAIDTLITDVEAIGAEFNDHYLRQNHEDGTLTVQVLGDDAQIEALRSDGYEITGTIEDSDTYWERIAERLRSIEEERAAFEVAREGKTADFDELGLRASVAAAAVDREITINRVDYFENYAGRFLSVEAWDRDTVRQTGGGQTAGQGPTLAVTWNAGGTTPIGSGGPRNMAPYIDGDPAQDTYLYHRMLIRIGAPNDPTPPRPTRIRVASSSGAFEEADVNVWTGAALPPHVAGFQRGFHSRYMDPTEIYAAMNQLATEYPNIAHMVNTPYKTNGYQRRAQATLAPVQTTLSAAAAAGASAVRAASTTNLVAGNTIRIGTGAAQEVRTIASLVTPNPAAPAPNVNLSAPLTNAHASGAAVQADLPSGNVPATAQQPQAVVLTSTAWGHQGGNDTTVELRNPNAMNAPLTVSVTGKDIVVSLATGAAGELTSTAAQVVAAINGNVAARALAKAHTFRNNTGAGIAQPRSKVNLSDFLAVSASIPASGIPHDNSHVQRGPFQPQVMRIGKTRDGSKVGVYLFCEQHAREWVTPITCYETAAELLKNYATDPLTREIVDNLEIFILPVVNPDGGHYSFYNFQSQRRNMTNHCVNGGKATYVPGSADDPMSPDFWTPRNNPSTGLPYASDDPGSRTAWGTDLNRNQSVGTIWEGYVGASHSCNNDVYAGPTPPDPITGPSEPEAKNEKWIVDTLGPNIKFSNNVHTSGGYFMWAPGAYKPTRETLPPPNIGIEKYFFAAAETVLGRIKEYRGNVVLPERTGPIADVLYSAAGNSADDNYYRKGIIGYSFEAGSDIFVNPTLTVASSAGATGIRSSSLTGMAAGDYITIGYGTPNAERRRIATVVTGTTTPASNVTLTEPLTNAHAIGEPINGGTAQQGVGFFPNYTTEGQHEANEFAAGNFGLLEAALAYSRDKTPPGVTMTGDKASQTPVETTFQYVNEPSVIHYTLDGSTPTFASPKWERQGLRRPGELFEFTTTTTVRWLAVDLAGNTSTGSQRFAIDSAAPSSTATAEQSPSGGFATVSITSDDNFAGGGAGVEEIQYRLNGGAWQTYNGAFSVVGNGSYTLEYFATDLAGNTEAPKTLAFTVATPERPLASCRIAVTSGKLRAGQHARVTATVRAGRVEVAGVNVTFRGPGISKAVRTNNAGVASTMVHPSRKGTLRLSVAANATSRSCTASRPVMAARRTSGVAGAGTGGAGLTGRPR